MTLEYLFPYEKKGSSEQYEDACQAADYCRREVRENDLHSSRSKG